MIVVGSGEKIVWFCAWRLHRRRGCRRVDEAHGARLIWQHQEQHQENTSFVRWWLRLHFFVVGLSAVRFPSCWCRVRLRPVCENGRCLPQASSQEQPSRVRVYSPERNCHPRRRNAFPRLAWRNPYRGWSATCPLFCYLPRLWGPCSNCLLVLYSAELEPRLLFRISRYVHRVGFF